MFNDQSFKCPKTQNLMPPIPQVLFACHPNTESENRVGIMLEAECLVAATIGFQLRKHRCVVFFATR